MALTPAFAASGIERLPPFPETDERTMEVSKEVLRNCVGLGLLACRLPSMKEALLDVFEAVRAVSPESPAWIIGMAMVYANACQNPQAACAFMMQQRISADAGDALAQAFLALFLAMAKRRSEAARVAGAVIADGQDPDAVRLAQSLLDHEIGNG